MESSDDKSESNGKTMKSKRNVKDNDEKIISLSKTDNEIGFQVFQQENQTFSTKKCKKEWESLDDGQKKKLIDEVFERSNNNRKHVLRINSENDSKQTTKITMEIQRLIGLPAAYSFQPPCYVCERYYEECKAVKCGDSCSRYLHPDCGINNRCIECSKNNFFCTFCRQVSNEKLISCQVSGCNRRYHPNCLGMTKIPYLSVKNFNVKICPAHFCISCVQEKGKFHECYGKKLIECIRCCNSYHLYDLCMVAGAGEISLSHIICPRHFLSTLIKEIQFATVNVTTCVVCFEAGPTIKCTFCPNSYHEKCVENASEASIVCFDCKSQFNPRIASVQFVKLAQYRWWPCEVIHMRNGPYNLVKRGWDDGTMLVRFLGTNEYQFVSKSRSIQYNTAEKIGLARETVGSSKRDKQFIKGLTEAKLIQKVYVNIVKRFVPLISITAPDMTDKELEPFINHEEESSASPVFEYLQFNKSFGDHKMPIKLIQPVCSCEFTKCEPPECINFFNKVQCDKSTCPSKDACKNQIFQNLDKNAIGVFKTHSRGHGLTVLMDITKDTFIYEYVGELISEKEADNRIRKLIKNKINNFHMIRIEHDNIVDAGHFGNLTRFINHSCSPNCRMEKWLIDGYYHLGIFANRDIKSNEELTISYHETDVLQQEDQFCLCNSFNCVGYLKIEPSKVSPNKNDFKGILSSGSISNALSEPSSPEPTKLDLTRSKSRRKSSKNITSPESKSSKTLNSISSNQKSTNKEEQNIVPEIKTLINLKTLSTEDKSSTKDLQKSSTDVSKSIEQIEKSDSQIISVSTNKRKSSRITPSASLEDITTSLTTNESIDSKESSKIKSEHKLTHKKSAKKSSKIHEKVIPKTNLILKVGLVSDVSNELETLSNCDQFDNVNVNSTAVGAAANIEVEVKSSNIKEPIKNESIDNKFEQFSRSPDKYSCAKVDKNGHIVDDIQLTDSNKETCSSHKPDSPITELNTANNKLCYDEEMAIESVEPENIDLYSNDSLETKDPPAILSPAKTKEIQVKARTPKKITISNKDRHGINKKLVKVTSEIACYRCFDGGELIVCDKEYCPKSYHAGCLGLSRKPQGKWYCPWHFCNVCGKRSVILCLLCSASYCEQHNTKDKMLVPQKPNSPFSHCTKHLDSLIKCMNIRNSKNQEKI